MYPTHRNGRVRLQCSTFFATFIHLQIIKFQAYPDIAAQADKFRFFLGGESGQLSNTSCASPTFTGIVSLLNDARLKADLPPLGFLNPFLYSIGSKGLNGITIGHNSGCGTQGFNVSQP